MIESTEMKPSSRTIVFATLLFYGLLVIAPHKIAVFAFTFCYFFVLWRLMRHFRLALMTLYLTLVPILVGKLFDIDLISGKELGIPGRDFGIAADIVITISDVTVAIMGVLLVGAALRREPINRQYPFLEFVLFLYAVGMVVATLMGSVRPDISIVHSAFAIKPLILYYFFSLQPTLRPAAVISVFTAGLFFELAIIMGQVLKGGSIGLVIETIGNYIVVDRSLDAAGLLRYGGTYMHANALAHAMLIPFCFSVSALFHPYGKKDRLIFSGFFAGLIVIILTMSRSVWLSAAIGLSIFFIFARFVWHYKLKLIIALTKVQRYILFGIIVVLGVLMTPRLISTLYSGGLYGSIETRSMLLKEYTQSLSTNLLTGVGLEMDVYVQYLRSSHFGSRNIDAPNRSVLLYFPEPVHNGFLRLIIQVGLVGALPYYVFVISLGYVIYLRLRKSVSVPYRFYGISLMAAYVAMIINGFMQPILPDMPVLTALTMIYLSDSV